MKYENDEDREHTLLQASPIEIEDKGDSQKLKNLATLVSDYSKGQATIIGYVYRVDPLLLLNEPDKLREFLKLCEDNKVKETYKRLKAYYHKLIEEKRNVYN